MKKEGILRLKHMYQKIWARLTRPSLHKMAESYFKMYAVHKLQLGTGSNLLEGWLNTDILPTHQRAFLDVRRRFSFNDRTFDYIFCEHLIEHLEYKQGVKMLKECFRILKPGGRMRIATPDLSFLTALHSPEKTEAQKRYIKWAVDSYLPDIGIYEDTFVINNFFRNWGHKFIYDFKILERTMKMTGFSGIVRCNTGESGDSNMKNLESHDKIVGEFNKLETFIVEAVKPDV